MMNESGCTIPEPFKRIDCDFKKPDQWIIPDEQTRKQMVKYAKKIQKDHPEWSIQRATRKIAEKFKLKKA